MTENRFDAYCGLYCGACEVMVAIKNGTIADRAKEWGRNVSELNCQGCKSDVVIDFCSRCYMKTCAESKGLEFCVECSDYPCENLKAFQSDEYPHHKIILKNLDRIREIGKSMWLEEQQKRWACSNCGEGFSWYAEACPKCRSKVNNETLNQSIE